MRPNSNGPEISNSLTEISPVHFIMTRGVESFQRQQDSERLQCGNHTR